MNATSDELILALATVIRAYADATALVMRKLNIDAAKADATVSEIRLGVKASRTSWAYADALKRAEALGIDWQMLLAIAGATAVRGDGS